MTQTMLQIPTAAPLSGLALVTDVNNALAGMASLNAGASAPSASSLGLPSAAGVLWHDTGNNVLKLRNQADNAWIVLGSVNESNGVFIPAQAQSYGLVSTPTTLASTNAGQFLLVSAATTVTLPASSGLTTAWSVALFAKGGPATVVLANGSDALNGTVNGTLAVPKGYYAQIATDAAGHYYAVVIAASLGISVLASADTTDLGTAANPVVSVSGTTAITSFGSAAPAGAIYTVQFSGALTLIYNAASMILPGAANISTAANDTAQFLSLGSGNWLCIDYQRASGQPVVNPSVNPLSSVSASVASNALTAGYAGGPLSFRSPTLSSGAPVNLSVGPLSLTVPSGATLGTVAGTQAYLALLVLYNGGAPTLGIANMTGGVNLDETTLLSATAISSSATSAGTVYTAVAVASSPFRVVGYLNITEATAGTWATGPTLVQGVGGQAMAAMQSLGMGQTWQSLTGKAYGTVYYNTTARSIQVIIWIENNTTATPTVQLVCNGVPTAVATLVNTLTSNVTLSCIVPPGGSYYCTQSSGTYLVGWSELR